MSKSMRKQLQYASLALALVLVGIGLLPGTADAAVDCALALTTADFDRDGLSDAEECAGITLFGGQGLVLADSTGSYSSLSSSGSSIPHCGSSSIRRNCVDPSSPDKFVMLVLVNPSNVPLACWTFDPINRPTTDPNGGLGVTTHILLPNPSSPQNLLVTVRQSALQLTESSSTTDGDFGITTWGAPNNSVTDPSPASGPPFITSYPVRIDNFLNKNGITDSTSHTNVKCRSVAHEVGHSDGLSALWNSNYGGPHYKTGSGYLMDQTIQIKSGKAIAPTKMTTAEPAQDCRTKIVPQQQGGTCAPFSP